MTPVYVTKDTGVLTVRTNAPVVLPSLAMVMVFVYKIPGDAFVIITGVGTQTAAVVLTVGVCLYVNKQQFQW